jgi:hypothetical protein
MPANIICPSHFGQGGRSIPVRPGSSEMSVCGMMLPLELGGERDTFVHRDVDSNGDAHNMNHSTTESLPNIDQFPK